MHEFDCPHCGTSIPERSRFCPECGRALEEGLLDAPLLARPASPVWPPDVVVVIAALVAIGGLILIIGAVFAWGFVALLVAAVLVLARTHLGSRTATQALADVRGRVAATREAMAARSREQVEIFRLRRELAELHAERTRLFRDLGYAVYSGDETGTEGARASIETADTEIANRESEVEALRHVTAERVERAQGPVRPTERLETAGEASRVPEPPWPPPDEGDPPDSPVPSPGEPTPGPEEPTPPKAASEQPQARVADS